MTPPPTHTSPRSRLPRLPDKGRMRDLYEQVAPVLAIVCLLAAFSAVGWSWQNSRADHRQDVEHIADNQANAVTSCENANESREASRTLWYFVVDLASKDAPPERVAYLGEVRAWIGKVYQPHDCSDLSRKYPLPPPPAIPAP
jgi:hypothetical protein